MQQVPEVKLIFSLTAVFIVGTVVFMVIFRSLLLVQELRQGVLLTSAPVEEFDIQSLQFIPWALGFLYLALVSVIIYFMYKRYSTGRGERPPIFGGFK